MVKWKVYKTYAGVNWIYGSWTDIMKRSSEYYKSHKDEVLSRIEDGED